VKRALSNPAAAGIPPQPSDAPTATEQSAYRIELLPRDAGWLLITAGVIGLAVPGVPGAPFLLAGAVVLAPGGLKLLARWSGRQPPKLVRSTIRQIGRFLDDLERRYPRR